MGVLEGGEWRGEMGMVGCFARRRVGKASGVGGMDRSSSWWRCRWGGGCGDGDGGGDGDVDGGSGG